MTKDRLPMSWYNSLRETVGEIECPKGCKKETSVKLQENGERIYVYCHGCMGIIYDSKTEERKLRSEAKKDNGQK